MTNLLLFLITSFCLLTGCQKSDETANLSPLSTSKPEEQIINICVSNPSNSQTIDVEKLPAIEKLKIFSTQKAWVLTGFKDGHIFLTNNAGQSWTKLEIQKNSYFNAFDFVDEQNGWVSDYKSDIWKTTDGGETWTKFSPFAKLITEKKFLQSDQIEFSNIDNGWLLDSFNIYQTNDGGISWKVVNLPQKQPQKMFFLNNRGWVIFNQEKPTSSLIVEFTFDKGQSWQTSKIEGTSSVNSVFFLDNNGWISGDLDKLFATQDAGKNWKTVVLPEKNFQIKSIFWLNKNEGWVAGAIIDVNKAVSDPFVSSPTALKTKDGGKTWEKLQPNDAQRFFNQVYFENSNIGWLTSKDKIYKTEDGGNSWKSVLKIHLTKNCDQLPNR